MQHVLAEGRSQRQACPHTLSPCRAEGASLLGENWQPWALLQGRLQVGGGALLISVIIDHANCRR